ncbi:MAG: gliding motility-associated C-terminal domain-containing protein [Bacteroidia bacterium]
MKKALLFFLLLGLSYSMQAQNVLYPGEAVTTRFAELSDTDYIVKVFDISAPSQNNAPLGGNWYTPMRVPSGPASLSGWTPRRLGRVFGVTIDTVGNIFVTATGMTTYSFSQYNATGFGSAGGGGIYKIANNGWGVTDFVTTLPAASGSSATQIPNTGVGLGNICYDKWNDQLFVTNMEDGKIYRISPTGTILSTFDPFSADNAAAGIAPLNERIWGISVYGGDTGTTRVYFARWREMLWSPSQRNEIWSVALDASGNFIGTEQLEISVPSIQSSGGGTNPTAQINFSTDGKMLLAERSMSTDSATDSHYSRAMLYTYSAGVWTGPLIYNQGEDIVTITTHSTNCTGGADFGYEFEDSLGRPTGCEQLVWMMADAIVYDWSSAKYIYGMAGVPLAGTMLNTTDINSYYMDETNDTTTVSKSYLGSMKVFRNCVDSTFTPPPPPPPPVPDPIPDPICETLNAVTPNGDGVHDFLDFTCVDSLGWRIEIYNRWGNKIYATDNYANNFPGGLLSDGVYYYILESPDLVISRAGFFHVWNGQQ